MNCQNFDSKIRRDHQKISYERRDYESVDEKKPILGYVLKNYEKKNSGTKGLKIKAVEISLFIFIR